MRGRSESCSAFSPKGVREVGPTATIVLRANRHRGGAGVARAGAGAGAPGRNARGGAHRRGGGLWSGRPGEPRVPWHDVAEPGHVRTSGTPVRVSHVRHAFLPERSLRASGGGGRGARSSRRAPRRARGDARSARPRSDPRAVLGTRPADTGARRDPFGRRHRSGRRWFSLGGAGFSLRGDRDGHPRRGPRNGAFLAFLARGQPIRLPRKTRSTYAEGGSFSGSVHDTVIVTVLVWNASVPAAGSWKITVPFGCVEGAVATSA
jgi:hypothetical protein